jgi:hypothetical protein
VLQYRPTTYLDPVYPLNMSFIIRVLEKRLRAGM